MPPANEKGRHRCRPFLPAYRSERVFLQVRHHLLERLDVIRRMRCTFEVTDALPLGSYVFGAETGPGIETGAQATFPAHLADPATSNLEQATSVLAGRAAEVHHQRADQLGLELLEHLRRDQAFGHARGARWGDGIDQNVVLA